MQDWRLANPIVALAIAFACQVTAGAEDDSRLILAKYRDFEGSVSYSVLTDDAYRQRFDVPAGNRPYPHMDLPRLDFVSLAAGMGVAARRIDDPDRLAEAARQAFASGRPCLLEVVVAGKDG